jgi:hypothetical protein
LSGFDAGNRQNEISATRAKNNMSSISTLPGSFAAETRHNQTLRRDASTKDIDRVDISFGGVPKAVVDRPIANRNKSFVEIGERKSNLNADHFRKETGSRDILLNATMS